MTSNDTARPETLDEIAARIGREHGKAAGSWVIDGNTSEDTARKIIAGFDDGDPAVMDMQPSPLSGEWADGLSIDDVIREIASENVIRAIADSAQSAVTGVMDVAEMISDDARDALLDTFEQGYSDGYWDEVIRAAKAMLPATVRDTLAAAGYDPANGRG